MVKHIRPVDWPKAFVINEVDQAHGAMLDTIAHETGLSRPKALLMCLKLAYQAHFSEIQPHPASSVPSTVSAKAKIQVVRRRAYRKRGRRKIMPRSVQELLEKADKPPEPVEEEAKEPSWQPPIVQQVIPPPKPVNPSSDEAPPWQK